MSALEMIGDAPPRGPTRPLGETEMKITEQTTLAELATYLTELNSPLVTLMKTITGSVDGLVAAQDDDRRRVLMQLAARTDEGIGPLHAVVYLPKTGTFHGDGTTIAEALEAALIGLRLARCTAA